MVLVYYSAMVKELTQNIIFKELRILEWFFSSTLLVWLHLTQKQDLYLHCLPTDTEHRRCFESNKF